MNERQRKLEKTKQYFLKNFVEDPIDGTVFDCEFLAAMNVLIERFDDSDESRKRRDEIEYNRVLGNQAHSM